MRRVSTRRRISPRAGGSTRPPPRASRCCAGARNPSTARRRSDRHSNPACYISAMTRKTKPGRPAALSETEDDAVSDQDIERFLAENRREIEEKLAAARKSIARGDVAP